MSSNLFRPEVMQERQAAWLGGIRLGHNPRFSAVAALALVLAGCLVTFAVWGQVARKARVPGVLMPAHGTVQLSANAAGVFNEQLVQEGEHVTAGQALFVLGTDRPTTEGSAAVLLAAHLAQRRSTLEAERAARIQQTRQRETALQDRIRALDHEIGQAQQEALLASRRVALAQKTLDRYQQMAHEGFVSDIQAQNKHEELIDLQARVESTQRNAATLQREQQSLQAERQANQRQLNIDLAQLDRALVSLAQESTENQSRQTIVITAPQSGVVSALHLPKGASVQAGQSVATLVPMVARADTHQRASTELQAHLYTLTPDGRRVDVQPDGIREQLFPASHGAPMFDDRRVKTVVFPSLTVGAQLVMRTRMTMKEALFPGHFSEFGGAFPQFDRQSFQVSVQVPADMRLKITPNQMQGGTAKRVHQPRCADVRHLHHQPRPSLDAGRPERQEPQSRHPIEPAVVAT